MKPSQRPQYSCGFGFRFSILRTGPDQSGWALSIPHHQAGRLSCHSDLDAPPPHLHFKVQARGYGQLTTQMYFAGDKEINQDSIYEALSPAQRKLVVVKFQPIKNVPTGEFKVVLGHLGQYSHLTTPVMD